MKLSYYLIPTALLTMTSISEAATIVEDVFDIAGNPTQNYTFIDGAGSVTLQAVFVATNNGVDAGAFTPITDPGVNRVGNNANSASDTANHFTSVGANNAEGFRVTISLLSSVNVDDSTIEFSFDSLGIRELAGQTDFSWSSSATTTAFTQAVTGEQLETLDSSTYANISTTAYTGVFSIAQAGSGQYLQLSDLGSNSGIGLTANFTAVPEPSAAALLGLGGLALILRRRK